MLPRGFASDETVCIDAQGNLLQSDLIWVSGTYTQMGTKLSIG